MAKTITFNWEGTAYTLEFNRKSVETMEKQGFIASEIADKPMTTLPMLFRGAFLMHHVATRRDTIDAIYNAMGNKMELLQKLAEMYNEPLEAMLDDGEDGKNLTWGANW